MLEPNAGHLKATPDDSFIQPNDVLVFALRSMNVSKTTWNTNLL